MFFKSAKRMKKSIDRLRSCMRIDPICPSPSLPKSKTSIEMPLEECVEEYVNAHSALKKRKEIKRRERIKRLIETVE